MRSRVPALRSPDHAAIASTSSSYTEILCKCAVVVESASGYPKLSQLLAGARLALKPRGYQARKWVRTYPADIITATRSQM